MKGEDSKSFSFFNSADSHSNGHDSEKESKSRADELIALSRVSAAISGLWDLEAILKVGLNSVLEIMHGVTGGVMLLDEQTKTLSYFVYHGLSAKYAEEMRFKLGEGIAGKVAQNGRAILLEDISSEPSAARPDLIKTEGLKAFLSVPLRAKDKILGVLNIASTMVRHFTKDHMYLLGSIGDQLGTAIEQAKLYERLRESRKRYQTLIRQMITIQEEERKRIARDLHDETSQQLTALTLNLQALIEMMEMGNVKDPEIKAMAKRTHNIAVQAHAEVSRLIRELRPTLLDTLGLPAAIRNLAETNLASKGVHVTTEFKGMEQRLSAETELTLFRVAQEAMSNIVRHSEAKKAMISLECNKSECILRIEDDGKGFNVSEITRIEKDGRGAGLFGVRERVAAVGGEAYVESQSGKGTKAIAKVPVVRSTNYAEDKGSGS
ncbi:MAG: GAF domain-containing sensor histidine kinase [Thermodesulfobacteriota bacterium]|nr:GAF domain-containing sensor histidine kinase [Thermodesulfobacteriota bacterium]